MVVVVIAVSSVFITDGVKDLRLEMFNKIMSRMAQKLKIRRLRTVLKYA